MPATQNWWRRRSLKLRLALWFTAIASAILLALLPLAYAMIQRQMAVEMDRQLRIDWNLIEAHLEDDGQGGVRWRATSPATPDSPGYAESWFDVWSGRESLLKHWPSRGAEALDPPRPGVNDNAGFHSITLANELPARSFQKPAMIGGRQSVLRVFRDESGIHATLRRILTGLLLGLPVAVALAASGGYLMAGRMLKPLGEMADEARQITSESLAKRLPVANPHDELGQLATVFNDTLGRLEGSFDSLRRFTADASHELRTPLTALRSVGEISLREVGDAGSLRETVGSMLEEAQRLHDLIDTLLMLARVESGRAPLQSEALEVAALVSDVCERIEVLASEKSQRIDISTEPALVVAADAVLLRQVVMNLLHNAIRYSPPGTVVRVRCFTLGADAVIEVADEGPGIAPEHSEKVFERFYRIDKARARADGGAGLGLALAKLFVEQNGGRIELESPPEGGSRFRVVLPQRNASPFRSN